MFRKNFKTKIEISARHIHINKNDFLTLFGDKANLTVRNYLSQGKEFASDYTVEVVGPDYRFEKVRVVGPFRSYTQFELSRTDSIKMGISAPYKISGDLPGATVKIFGPLNEIIGDFAIVAKRHLHIPPLDAKRINVRDGQYISISVGGERAVTFDRVVVRISDDYKLMCHLDTDEGNAAGITEKSIGTIIK